MAVVMGVLLLVEFVSIILILIAIQHNILTFAIQVMAYFAKRSYLALGGVRFFNGPELPRPSEKKNVHASPGAMPYDYQVQPQYYSQNELSYDPYREAR
jgi:hypothetical protein